MIKILSFQITLLLCVGSDLHAAEVDLNCMTRDLQRKREISIHIDSTRQTLTMGATLATGVRFSSNEVYYEIGRSDGTYSHRLSRLTGVLTSFDPGGRVFIVFDCARTQQKF